MDFQTACKLTNEDARAYLEKLRWGAQPFCAHCGCVEVTKLQGKATRPGVYKCRGCRKQFTVTVGTIFSDSHIELRHWLMAFSLICSSKKGVSSLQLKRMLQLGSYESALFLSHRIRHVMRNEPLRTILNGTVEVDETYVGGKPRNKGKNARGRGTKKTPVVALIQRNGPMRCKVVQRVSSTNLRKAVTEAVDPMTSKLHTDEWPAYRTIGRVFAEGHETVNHGEKEYSRAGVNVNSCESWFALLKRGVHGTFHHVSKQHLQRYCDEFAFRWNHRETTDAERTEAALKLAPGARLTYKMRKISA